MVGKGDDASKFACASPTIVVATQLTPRGVEISVTDNGPGIAEENIEKILEPLFTTKNFGTGLGLPAVQKIMEQHGGGLDVMSKPGEGARFTAWMPLQRLQQEAA
jgi:signal transduction histidine kinase